MNTPRSGQNNELELHQFLKHDGSSYDLDRDKLSQIFLTSVEMSTEEKPKPTKMTWNEKLTVITFCFSNFGLGVFYSILGPFFPVEAEQKGVSSTMIGLIVGVYELVSVVVSPILGSYITQIGNKFMFVMGTFTLGYCSVIFGFLDLSPPGTTYATLCFVVRCFEGLGAAGLMTASYAVMSYTFPDNVATMFGMLELFTGVGLMIGPPIGGWLYQIGGFRLPFVACGTILMLVAVIVFFILPNTKASSPRKGSIFTLMRSPVVILSSLLLLCGTSCIGFVDISLGPLLANTLHISPVTRGFIFLVGSIPYAIATTVWGMIADKFPGKAIWIVIFGYILAGSSFWLYGPVPFIPIVSYELWIVLVAQTCNGIGLGTMAVSLQLLSQAARDRGMPDNIGTYGIISATFASFFSFGAFLGPMAGGMLIDSLGFRWASFIIGTFTVSIAFLTMIYAIWIKCIKKQKSEDIEIAPLLNRKSDFQEE